MNKKLIHIFFIFFFASIAYAAVPEWKIVPADSHLTFTATQNNAPVSGEFKNFSGLIKGDPADLANSSVNISVSIGSLSTSYQELEDTLKSSDWFDVNIFPHAIFKSDQFTKTGDKTFETKGSLTIRDKTLPVTLKFQLIDYAKDHAFIKGSTTIKRTDFGVGQGEWAETKDVKNDVLVEFTLKLQR